MLDARRLGFDVVMLTDAIVAVDARAGDGMRAIDEIRATGVKVATRASLCG